MSSPSANLSHKTDIFFMGKPVGTHADGTRCWTIDCKRRAAAVPLAAAGKRLTYDEKRTMPEYANKFKVCSRCKRSLPLYEFAVLPKKSTGFSSDCRDCKKEYNTNYYTKNKLELDLKSNLRGAQLQKQNQAYIQQYKQSHPCIDCGMANTIVLDFDHKEGSKKKVNIGEVTYNISLQRLKEEIAKCDIRCANCHRIKTYGDNTWRTGRVIATEHLGRIQRNTALAKIQRQNLIKKYMQYGCVDCGNEDLRVLELDHVRDTKVMHVSDMVRRGIALEAFKAELLKCDVRCANCHRLITHERRNVSSLVE